MKPTPQLRFVEREVRIPICEGMARCEHHKFLQQWWVDADAVFDAVTKDIRGEWRDIPTETEQ